MRGAATPVDCRSSPSSNATMRHKPTVTAPLVRVLIDRCIKVSDVFLSIALSGDCAVLALWWDLPHRRRGPLARRTSNARSPLQIQSDVDDHVFLTANHAPLAEFDENVHSLQTVLLRGHFRVAQKARIHA